MCYVFVGKVHLKVIKFSLSPIYIDVYVLMPLHSYVLTFIIDPQVSWFSFDANYHIEREQMCCYLTRTTKSTHQLIRDNLHETPTYGGWVEAKGPRYCPSIEDKVLYDAASYEASLLF